MDPTGIGALVVLVAVVGIGVYAAGRMTARRAVNAKIAFSPEPARIGRPLSVTITVNPRRDVQVDAIEITLACHRAQENCAGEEQTGLVSNLLDLVSRDSHDDCSHRHVERDILCSEKVHFPFNRKLSQGRRESLQYQVPVSAGGVGTARRGALTVRWVLAIRFDIPGFPDAIWERDVDVAPRYA